MSTRKQPSFGGVAALFGDEEQQQPVRQKKQNPSFGGVAGLFGDSTSDLNAAPITTSAPGKTKAKPSFGGVAAMFGDDDEKPPSQLVTKTKGKNASFGGVASLFGEQEDDDKPKGVSNLFDSQPKQTSQKRSKRDPSINGISSLFQNIDDDTDDHEDNQILMAEDLQKNFRQELVEIKEKVKQTKDQLDRTTQSTTAMQKRIQEIEEETKFLKESKFNLIRHTAEEMTRMKGVISEYHTILDRQEGKAATIG